MVGTGRLTSGGGGPSTAALDCGRGVGGGGCLDGQAFGVVIRGGRREEVVVVGGVEVSIGVVVGVRGGGIIGIEGRIDWR